MVMRRVAGGIVALAFVWGVAIGQPPARKSDPQSKIEPRGEPGEGQKFLGRMVGDWLVEKAFHPCDGGEPARSRGECRQTMIHDGRFLQSDFTFGTGTTRTTGMGLIGFESRTGKFTSVWTDCRQTKMSFRQAGDKFDGQQIVLFGQPLGDEKDVRKSRTVTRLEDNDQRIVHRQYSDGENPPRLVMELVMTRKKPSAPEARPQ